MRQARPPATFPSRAEAATTHFSTRSFAFCSLSQTQSFQNQLQQSQVASSFAALVSLHLQAHVGQAIAGWPTGDVLVRLLAPTLLSTIKW